MGYEVGDRVVGVDICDNLYIDDQHGYIKACCNGEYLVEFDEDFDEWLHEGHSNAGCCDYVRGWWVDEAHLTIETAEDVNPEVLFNEV